MDEPVLQAAKEQWPPSDHPVFQLVAQGFAPLVSYLDQTTGAPLVEFKSFWDIYNLMVG